MTYRFLERSNLLNIHNVNSEDSKIFNIGVFESKWPYLLHKMGFVDSQSNSTVLPTHDVDILTKFRSFFIKSKTLGWSHILLSYLQVNITKGFIRSIVIMHIIFSFLAARVKRAALEIFFSCIQYCYEVWIFDKNKSNWLIN